MRCVIVYTLPPTCITCDENGLQTKPHILEGFADSIAHILKMPDKAEDFRAVKFVRLA